MNTRLKFNKGDIIFVILLLVSVAALVNVFVLMSQYSSGTSEQALLMSSAYAEDAGSKFTRRMDIIRERTQSVANVAASLDSMESLYDYLGRLQYDDAYGTYIDDDIHFFVGDREYNQRGDLLDQTKEDPEVLSMRTKGVLATYGLIYKVMGPCVACYCPVAGSDLLDGVVVYYLKETALAFADELDRDKLQYAELMALCSQNYTGAHVLTVLADKTGTVKENS